ncbi:MAG: integrase core domain-containing protein [Planctomycetota bacterium]|nr:integrase core domain-containing protein [Planctomycetota bacterium]
MRDEFLNMEIFNSLGEWKKLAGKWKEYYNKKRRHSSLDNQTPSERAAFCRTRGFARANPLTLQKACVCGEPAVKLS